MSSSPSPERATGNVGSRIIRQLREQGHARAVVPPGESVSLTPDEGLAHAILRPQYFQQNLLLDTAALREGRLTTFIRLAGRSVPSTLRTSRRPLSLC